MISVSISEWYLTDEACKSCHVDHWSDQKITHTKFYIRIVFFLHFSKNLQPYIDTWKVCMRRNTGHQINVIKSVLSMYRCNHDLIAKSILDNKSEFNEFQHFILWSFTQFNYEGHRFIKRQKLKTTETDRKHGSRSDWEQLFIITVKRMAQALKNNIKTKILSTKMNSIL